MTIGRLAGGPRGYMAMVTDEGKLLISGEVTNTVQSEVTNTVQTEVNGTVATSRAPYSVTQGRVTIGTSSTTVANAHVGRQALWLKNVGSATVFLRFDGDEATTEDWPLDPGEEIRADIYCGEDGIAGIVASGDSVILVLEMG